MVNFFTIKFSWSPRPLVYQAHKVWFISSFFQVIFKWYIILGNLINANQIPTRSVINSNMGEKSRPTFLFVSFGAERGLTSVDCLWGKTNNSSSDGHSGSGITLTSRNLLLLRDKLMWSIISHGAWFWPQWLEKNHLIKQFIKEVFVWADRGSQV